MYPHHTNEYDDELEVTSDKDEDGDNSEEDEIIELKVSTDIVAVTMAVAVVI